MSAFLQNLIDRLERELVTLGTRIALDKSIGPKEITGYISVMELWANSARELGEPWCDSVLDRTREMALRFQEGWPLEQVHVHFMQLIIDTSNHLRSTRDSLAQRFPSVPSGRQFLRAGKTSPLRDAV